MPGYVGKNCDYKAAPPSQVIFESQQSAWNTFPIPPSASTASLSTSMFLLLLSAAAASNAITASGCSTQQVKQTFYGWPDNDPAGPAIAYDCGRGYTAGGSGTYDDPPTFASGQRRIQ